jgi:hypothetical protein
LDSFQFHILHAHARWDYRGHPWRSVCTSFQGEEYTAPTFPDSNVPLCCITELHPDGTGRTRPCYVLMLHRKDFHVYYI